MPKYTKTQLERMTPNQLRSVLTTTDWSSRKHGESELKKLVKILDGKIAKGDTTSDANLVDSVCRELGMG